VREWLGDLERAADAFRSTLATEPADAQGAAARLALLGKAEPPVALPEAYVARLFDQYAPRFDAHLTQKLGYRAPALIADALNAAAPGRRFASALDIGCGAGLMGQALRERVDHLTGVDLSPGMIAKASARGLYDALIVGEATMLLECNARAAFDLVVAADSLVYIGDLAPLIAAIAGALTPGGLFALTVETGEGDGFALGPAMRFAHTRAYVEATAARAGLRPLLVQTASARREAGVETAGLIFVLGLAAIRRSADPQR
jgi:predicted TPR repeat methyltransferase